MLRPNLPGLPTGKLARIGEIQNYTKRPGFSRSARFPPSIAGGCVSAFQKKSMPRLARCRLALFLFAVAVSAVVAREAAAQRIARSFAPGVLTVIPPAPQAEELYSGPQPLVELPVVMKDSKYEPKLASPSTTIYERSQNALLRRTVWNLEFAFKPMRMIYVDVSTLR